MGGGNFVSYDWLVFLVSLKAIVDVPILHLECIGELVHRLQGGVQQLVVAHAGVLDGLQEPVRRRREWIGPQTDKLESLDSGVPLQYS